MSSIDVYVVVLCVFSGTWSSEYSLAYKNLQSNFTTYIYTKATVCELSEVVVAKKYLDPSKPRDPQLYGESQCLRTSVQKFFVKLSASFSSTCGQIKTCPDDKPIRRNIFFP